MDYEEYLTEEERQALKTECPFYKDECSNHPKCNFKINHGCHLMKAGADILELGEKLNSIDERLNELESSIRWHNEDLNFRIQTVIGGIDSVRSEIEILILKG